ncbi:hypothetical protein AKJ66_00120 [candidate division MSBL1 archaeon SCGC-AAA259E22]|uniref:Uncharacterized protein n=1 Tax=candidate division MSBL1 archaeon SCGC-AAA259E22 TaxID=1698265 RepID=A0A133UIK5_9EURY|nr:hypothetical protein AKJ66_00120 [candidate division MSBL1 archaeon SCGC-AAA259E22]
MNASERERKAEQVDKLLTAEKFVLAKLGRGELGRREAGKIASRINTAVVSSVREALEDRGLAEKLLETFEEAIEKRSTATPQVASTLSKVLAMRHGMEFNGHRPSEEDLEANLAALWAGLDLNNIEEKYAELKENSRGKKVEGKEREEEGNEMYA